MKKIYYLAFLLISCFISAFDDVGNQDEYLRDEIIVVIYGSERKRIICASDIRKLSLDGRKKTLLDLIIEELIYQDGLRYKIPIDEEAIDKYIFSIQKQFKITLEEVKKIFKASGYSYEEGRDELRIMYLVNAMLDRLKAQIFIGKNDVEKYHQENREHKEARYKLEVAFIKIPVKVTKNEFQETLRTFARTGKGLAVSWREPLWLKESDIAEDMQFLTSMKIGQVSEPQEVVGGFELYKLVAKKPSKQVPLDKKRYQYIVDMLRKPKFEKAMKDYQDKLLESATVVYLNPAFKPTQLSPVK